MSDLYRVIFRGELQEGLDKNSVLTNLATISRMDKSQAEKLLQINKPTVLKKGLPEADAKKLAQLLTRAGLKVGLQAEASTAPEKVPEPQATPQPKKVQKQATIKRESDNPYAAPDADLGVDQEFDGEWLSNPNKLPASRGWQWISGAARMFFGQPFMWLGMGLIAGVISILFSLVPVVGPLLNYIPVMILAGGFMYAAQQQMEGNPLYINYIFSGLSHNRNQLVLLGLLNLLGAFAIGIITTLVFFQALGTSFLPLMLGQEVDPETLANMTPNPIFMVAAFLFAFALSIPVLMAMWFASPLVAVANQSAVQALKLSFKGCLRNILPFLIYGLAMFIIGMVITIGFSAVMGILGFFGGDGGFVFLIFITMIFFLLLALPLALITGLSIYTGFVDIFSKTSTR